MFLVDSCLHNIITGIHCSILFLMQIFEATLRACPESRKALITWLVLCFESNNDRGKMSSLQILRPPVNEASDGFFVNLSWIMLRLCSPFMALEKVDSVRKARVRAIDVSYCAVNDKNKAASVDGGGPLIDFSGDSKLVPHSSGVCLHVVYLYTHLSTTLCCRNEPRTVIKYTCQCSI